MEKGCQVNNMDFGHFAPTKQWEWHPNFNNVSKKLLSHTIKLHLNYFTGKCGYLWMVNDVIWNKTKKHVWLKINKYVFVFSIIDIIIQQ